MILSDIRVIDWSVQHAAPAAAAMLADLGAEVIHVETPETGDQLRGVRESRGASWVLPCDRNAPFEDLNRNKKGIAVDVRTPAGLQVMYDLIKKSDVLITNFRLRAIKRLRLDYETLHEMNSKLVYAESTLFGEKGPDSETPGVELLGYARSGIMMASGDEGMPPVYTTMGSGDRITGVYLAYGIVVALLARSKSGKGQKVTTSLLSALIGLQSATVITELLTGKKYPRLDRARARNPIYSFYQCKEGRWLAFAVLQSDRYWHTFCQGLGRPELEADTRFSDSAKRAKNCEELVRLLQDTFMTRKSSEWESAFHKAGDIAISRINDISDLAMDRQVVENNYIQEYDHPELGRVKFVGFPVQWSEVTPEIRMPAPSLGQHTEQVLTDICGYSWDRIEKLKSAGVVP